MARGKRSLRGDEKAGLPQFRPNFRSFIVHVQPATKTRVSSGPSSDQSNRQREEERPRPYQGINIGERRSRHTAAFGVQRWARSKGKGAVGPERPTVSRGKRREGGLRRTTPGRPLNFYLKATKKKKHDVSASKDDDLGGDKSMWLHEKAASGNQNHRAKRNRRRQNSVKQGRNLGKLTVKGYGGGAGGSKEAKASKSRIST